MSEDEIYLLGPDGRLVPMRDELYESEGLLQSLVAQFPDVLAGGQMNRQTPRRWALVKREAGVGSAENANQWSLDHLFVDQDGIPTLVEVKRSSDTRIRREVVGQMLDYAANAVRYWPIEQMRERFTLTQAARGWTPEQALTDLLGADADTELFWQQVDDNLRAGHIRMVFLADRVPPELQAIVEFMNEQMSPAEVIAVEVRQYVGEGLKTLVPRVIGLTAQAQQKRSSSAARQWDETSFMSEAESNLGTEATEAARDLLRWIESNGYRVWWGKGAKMGSFYACIDHGEESRYPFAVWTTGSVNVLFAQFKKVAPYAEESKRKALLHRLNEIPGVTLPPDAIDRELGFPLKVLATSDSRKKFLEAMDEVASLLKAD